MVMTSTSAVGRVAFGAVNRRSKRLITISQRSTFTANSILSSLSATTNNNDDENTRTPSRESANQTTGASIHVPITPSPLKTKSVKAQTQLGNPASSKTRRKRKRPSSVVLPDTPVSRKLELEDDDTYISATATMVENNDLELTTDMVASINPSQGFVDLEVSPEELRPSNTLTTGQCFHWRVVHPTATTKAGGPSSSPASTSGSTSAWGTHDATEWVGTLRLQLFDSCESVVLVVRELPDTTLYRPLATTLRRNNNHHSKTAETEEKEELHRAILEYFQLNVSMVGLYEEWSGNCPRLSKIAECIPGVRIVRQDPWECLVSFICSSNNNIPRITKMLASIRREYGQPLLRIPATAENIDDEKRSREYHQLYSFPSLDELALQATDEDLRGKCGMGYRSSYILETTKLLRDESRGGEAYLRTVLRKTNDPIEVQTKLCDFKGVGRKVADCVALFSLDQENAIPVDTHVWNIAIRDYDPEGTLKTSVKSLTPSNYKMVGDIFKSRFPNKPGWAHSLLFVAELPSFKALLPNELVDEMETFQKEEKERKKQQNMEKKKK